jgi:membrane associated rhomboid family serine protease
MIPYSIDKRLQHPPLVNYALIAANAFVFVFMQHARGDLPVLDLYLLHPDQPELHQFLSCMFLHGDWLHLVGNMIFLWVFGNAVNDSLGHVGYLAFYLAGGVLAGLGYILLAGGAPVLGASGAISAVTGAFLVLFPRVRVKVLVPLFYVLMPMEISSLFFLLLQFLWNIFETVRPRDIGVAYSAHSTGYVFGIGLAAVLLWTRLLPRDVYDLPSLVRTWRRRWRARRTGALRQETPGGPVMPPPFPQARPVAVQTIAGEVPATASARELELRRQIAADHGRGDLAAAAGRYLNLVQLAEGAVLPLTQQLDLANYLMSTQQHPAAADAYERFLASYPQYEYLADILLMLGLIYSRYLRQDERAETYLARAVPDLMDVRKAELARAELAKVRQRLGQ